MSSLEDFLSSKFFAAQVPSVWPVSLQMSSEVRRTPKIESNPRKMNRVPSMIKHRRTSSSESVEHLSVANLFTMVIAYRKRIVVGHLKSTELHSFRFEDLSLQETSFPSDRSTM